MQNAGHIAGITGHVHRSMYSIAPIRIFEPPLRLDRLNVVLMWHDSTYNNPLHRWMRDLVAKLFTH